MKRSLVVACVATVLAGCQTKPVEEMSYSEVHALAGVIMKRCEAQGVTQKSPQFKACTDQEGTREIAMRRKNRESQLAMAAGMQAMSDVYKPKPQVNCVSNRMGSSVYTNCY